jgi:hypothetical protein
MPDTPRPHRRPSPRWLFAVAVAAAVAGFILTLSYGYADHAPAPHTCGGDSHASGRRRSRP